jgi:hypothetical protein
LFCVVFGLSNETRQRTMRKSLQVRPEFFRETWSIVNNIAHVHQDDPSAFASDIILLLHSAVSEGFVCFSV